jgi:hypothetical protein
MAAIFLAHAYKAEKDEKLKAKLETIRDWLVKERMEDGGWVYGKYTKRSHAFLTNSNTIALFVLKFAGIDVGEEVFEKLKKYYSMADVQRDDGSLNYYPAYKPVREMPTGYWISRTLVGLWPMHILGMSDTETWKKAGEFAEKNLKDLDLSQHGPSYHIFWCGLSCFYGKDMALWKEYNSIFRDQIIKSQKENGSIFIEAKGEAIAPVDKSHGPRHTTQHYAILLLLQKGNLLFDKLGKK